jgi:putative Mg2+ transporter-C (MgtC) family protein
MDGSLGMEVVAARLGMATLLGAVLGLERELRGQPAGLRTHILVSLGSALFTLASLYVALPLSDSSEGMGVRADVTRIASQVVVGIGFLGGGSILRHGTTIKGLTTAANLWLTASIGLAAGLGFHSGAALSMLFGLFALSGLRPLERWVRKRRASRPPSPDELPEDEQA